MDADLSTFRASSIQPLLKKPLPRKEKYQPDTGPGSGLKAFRKTKDRVARVRRGLKAGRDTALGRPEVLGLRLKVAIVFSHFVNPDAPKADSLSSTACR